MLYEFHLTTRPLTPSETLRFTCLCRDLGGKAVLIALPEGVHTQQPMLSFVCREAGWTAARARMVELAQALSAQSFAVARSKAEVPADCAAAFRAAHPQHPDGYYEWHGKIRCTEADLPKWQAFGAEHGAKLSANTLHGKNNTRFLTLRHYGSYDGFLQQTKRLTADLTVSGCLLKQHYEYCVHDSRTELDAGWI